MFLDPKVVSKPKMSLIEVVGHIIIDYRTKQQVISSMYEVRNPKNVQKSSREDIYNLAQKLDILAQVTKGCVTSLKTAFEQNDRLISYVTGSK